MFIVVGSIRSQGTAEEYTMQDPQKGTSNNPSQNPYTPYNQNPYSQEPYRAEATNNPTQEPYRGDAGRDVRQGQGYGMTGTTAPPNLPFDQPEWETLVSTPLQVSLAMMAASPSGPLGMISEAMAIGKSIQTLHAQGQMSPMLAQLGQSVTKEMESMRSGKPMPFGDVQHLLQNPAVARDSALASCQRSASILGKASPQDATSYKQLVYAFANNVAAAGREGGFLGLFGGVQISLSEETLLNDIASALNLPRA
ncbi:hypothetical protein ccbrp13_02550 [Ktedonobacteria bacterium brp13]|nr:hypothetical protein ccbrp13_02550 [Ktedonobacteria bacterium brp13]